MELDIDSIQAAYQTGQDDASLGDLPELIGPNEIIDMFGETYAPYYWKGVREYRALVDACESRGING